MNNKLIEEIERQKIFLRDMRNGLITVVEEKIAREIERLNLLELRVEKESLTGGATTYRLEDIPMAASSVIQAPLKTPSPANGTADEKQE